MEFWIIVLLLIAISFIAALLALKSELSKPKEIEHVKKELSRERVMFVRQH